MSWCKSILDFPVPRERISMYESRNLNFESIYSILVTGQRDNPTAYITPPVKGTEKKKYGID